MAKLKKSFFCQNCGSQFPQWMGQCSNCREWNTLVEEIIEKGREAEGPRKSAKAQKLNEVQAISDHRVPTAYQELNRVLGGGIVPGSVALVGGEPGIGKSTLLLQVALTSGERKVLYVSGEESATQIKMRAQRISNLPNQCFILTETLSQNILKEIEQIRPDLVIIDSIQTLSTSYIDASPGSVSQIRACTTELIKVAKETGIPVLLIGHITKEGQIAGPKILEHMVDVVLQFEGDRNHVYRLLRANKNRFGSTSEIGIFEMHGSGLKEVQNPSEVLLSKRDELLSGNAIAVTLEGVRPMLVEMQALVSSAVYGTPQRSCTGFDSRRLNMLLAVLEKRAGFYLNSKDVFLNITGGIRVEDPALDLAVVAAVLSSDLDVALPASLCFAAEVGLSGEVRPVNRIDQRISEAEKLGYQRIFISKYSKVEGKSFKIRVEKVAKVEEVYAKLF